MTDFQNKNLIKAFLEIKNEGRKTEGMFRHRQKKLQHQNQYQNLILVSVADIETRFWSYVRLAFKYLLLEAYGSRILTDFQPELQMIYPKECLH